MRGDARERPLRARQVGLEGQAVRGPGAAGRRRPGAAAAALRRRSALDEGARHREGHGLAGRAQAGDAADRADLRGHLRPDDVRGRGEEAHPRRDRREDRRQADRRHRAARAAGRRAGDRPGRGAARQPRRKGAAKAKAAAPAKAAAAPAAEPAPAEAAKERKGVKRARQGRGSRSLPRRARGRRSDERDADASTVHDPQHPGDAGPLARRHHRPDRFRLRRAEPRRRATSTASPSRTWCCCAPRVELQAAQIPPRKILRLAAQAEGDAAGRAAAHGPAHQRGRQRRHGARRPLAVARRHRASW